MKLKTIKELPGSFRDPSGFLFREGDTLYRQVNLIYKENYDHLMNSGLYKDLTESGLLIKHSESDTQPLSASVYKIIKPEVIPFISYPYEWSFSELKDAALLTLKIQMKALDYGMTLKDCSAYNVQFLNGRPVFIDTLSFDKYNEGDRWVAYKQFSQHFLAPLALASIKDIRLNQLLRIYIDGIPLDLASSLLPFSTRFSFSLLSHIHMQAKSQKYFADKQVKVSKGKMSRISFLGLINNLESAVKKLEWKPQGTEWGDYYNNTNYSERGFSHKDQMVSEFLDKVNPKNVWDLGANEGVFSRIAARKGIPVVSFDIDPVAVEKNYLSCKRDGETKILPLILDLTNPSPGVGWGNRERMSLRKRRTADAILALALIHHLAISNNLPFERIARFFSKLGCSLIIEFVPKEDSQVQKLLATREDIFDHYTQKDFEEQFGLYFNIEHSGHIAESKRVLYLMSRKEELSNE